MLSLMHSGEVPTSAPRLDLIVRAMFHRCLGWNGHAPGASAALADACGALTNRHSYMNPAGRPASPPIVALSENEERFLEQSGERSK